ncbi:MAG: ABC transporter substrate-binding protein [Alphaproteobacteria bacterium]|nr:ABC transporter substrate-binding protein [Alphaproteobacteria bacterium]
MTSRKWLVSALASMVLTLPGFADVKTEEYVRINANEVLASLNAPDLDAAGRRASFQAYMDEFTNIEAIARFTIGKYSRRFTPEEMEAYTHAFREYALEVYEYYFNEYRGQDVKVVGSTDRNARDSIVDTRIVRDDGKELDVRWRVLYRGDKYQVVDVALNVDGNIVWLGIEQQAQFLALLDKSNGSANDLINKINGMTADLVAQRDS